MHTIPNIQGKKIAVLGLGLSGKSAAEALVASGAQVFAWDELDTDVTIDGVHIQDLMALDWREIDALVLSPGIPHKYPQPHPIAQKAIDHNVPIVCDIELFARSNEAGQIIGVTGTNGKSTTSSLIAHIIQQNQRACTLGGNIGDPILDQPMMDKEGYCILELSSYQLERAPSLFCNTAICLNVTPDHLERHGGMDGYIAAKQLIFKPQSTGQKRILCIDSNASLQIYHHLKAQKIEVITVSTVSFRNADLELQDGKLIDHYWEDGKEVFDCCDLTVLKGPHNHLNLLIAYAVLRANGFKACEIFPHADSFKMLDHRLQQIDHFENTRYINDSKGTNCNAAVQALKSYEHIYWLAGGNLKEANLSPLQDGLANVRCAYLFGASAKILAEFCKDKVHYRVFETLEEAFNGAHKDLQNERGHNVVLLSPACESFDQFKNYQERGDVFKQLVFNLRKTTEVLHENVRKN